MKNISLNLFSKISFITILVVFSAFVSFGLVTSKFQTEMYKKMLIESSRTIVDTIANRSYHFYLIEDFADLDTVILESIKLPNVLEIQAFTYEGSILSNIRSDKLNAQYNVVESDKLKLPLKFKEVEEYLPLQQKFIVWRLIKDSKGWIRVVFDMQSIPSIQKSVWENTFFLILLWVSLSLILLLFSLRKTTSDIQKLSLFARDLQKNKGQKIIVKDNTYEIKSLMDSLNFASKELEISEKEMHGVILEKEILIKEVYHRVKNNMQVIVGLLQLQSYIINDSIIKRIFSESQNRILAMALVHEKLYKSPNLNQILFNEYVKSLTDSLLDMYGRENIKIIIDAPEVSFDIDTMIPCGLILNELLTNSFKYAFPHGQAGIIKIKLEKKSRDEDSKQIYEIIFCDNGIGFPVDIDLDNSKTLGYKLILMLVKQLHGKFEVKNLGGAEFRFVFSKKYERSIPAPQVEV